MNFENSMAIRECIEKLLLVENQLHSARSTNVGQMPEAAIEDFNNNLETYWNEIGLVSKNLTKECTKLCIFFCYSTTSPSSAELSIYLETIEMAVLTLVNQTRKLNPMYGKALHEELLLASVSALQATRRLLQAIREESGLEDRYRQATGIVWEGCRKLEHTSRNNKDAVLLLLKTRYSLVCDASNEISKALESDEKVYCYSHSSSDDEFPEWSDRDKEFTIPTVVNIIKAVKMFYKGLIEAITKNGLCDTILRVLELDQILEDSRPISEGIDSLISEIYPPLNIVNVDLQTKTITNQVISVLESASKCHVITEEEQTNIEFIRQAIHQNLDKMKDVLTGDANTLLG